MQIVGFLKQRLICVGLGRKPRRPGIVAQIFYHTTPTMLKYGKALDAALISFNIEKGSNARISSGTTNFNPPINYIPHGYINSVNFTLFSKSC